MILTGGVTPRANLSRGTDSNALCNLIKQTKPISQNSLPSRESPRTVAQSKLINPIINHAELIADILTIFSLSMQKKHIILSLGGTIQLDV